MKDENKIENLRIRVFCRNRDEVNKIVDDIKGYSKDIQIIVRKNRSEYRYTRGPARILIIKTKCLDLEDKFCSYLKSIEAKYTITHSKTHS